MPNEPVLPPSIRIATRPGEIVHQDFVVPSPPRGTLTATVIGDASIFRLTQFVGYGMVKYRLTDEEFEQLPPALQNEAHRWAVEFKQVVSAGPGQPMAVNPELHVTGIIEFCPPAGGTPDSYRATLAIDGLGPRRVEVPLLFVVGDLRVEFPPGRMVVLQNRWARVPVKVTLPGAPDTDLTLAVTHGYAEIPSTRVHVPRGGTAEVSLSLLVRDNAPLGPLDTLLTVTGHSIKFDYVPFQVEIRPPPPPPPTLNRQVAIDRIHQHYQRTGGANGPLGYPMTAVQFNDPTTATRYYRGGRVVATLRDGPIGVVTQALETTKAVITFLGFKCVRESSWDQMTDTDEPYFVMSIDNGNGQPRVQKFGHFENVETGTEVGDGRFFIFDSLTPNPLSIRVEAYEWDRGDPDETARKLQEKFVELARAGQSLAAGSGADAADGPGIGPAATAGVVGAVGGPLGSLAAVAVVTALGLGDDWIGQGMSLQFSRPEMIKTPERKGSFMGVDYNAMIEINGGDEGHYQLFFDISVRVISEKTI